MGEGGARSGVVGVMEVRTADRWGPGPRLPPSVETVTAGRGAVNESGNGGPTHGGSGGGVVDAGDPQIRQVEVEAAPATAHGPVVGEVGQVDAQLP